MAVITISQGTHSGGRMLAQAIARRLGYRCLDRDEVIAKAAEWGVSQDDLRTAIEKPPSFFSQSQHTKYLYLAFIQAALTEEARRGNLVYDGLAGHLLLGKGQHVLRARIVAPVAFRAAMVEFHRQCSRQEALAYIERVDEERRKWTRFLYGVDWTDPAVYDIVLNLEQMTLVEACDAICALAESSCFQPTPETQADLDDLALASSVRAHLVMHADTSRLQFEIMAKAGAVAIKGDIDTPEQARAIRSFVAKLPGVRRVSLEELALVTRI